VKPHLLLLIILLMFPQQPCGVDSIVVISDESGGAALGQFNPSVIDVQTDIAKDATSSRENKDLWIVI